MESKFLTKYEKLRRISYLLGNDSDLIQGAGGNTSLKIKNKLWIKASGKRLKDVYKSNIFCELELDQILKKFHGNFEKGNIVKHKNNDLRPSIETLMHAIIPHSYVFHSHAIDIISLTLRKNSEELFEEILNDIDYELIPYIKPGYNLAKEISKSLKPKKHHVFILENHGLIVSGDNAAKTIKFQKLILNLVKQKVRKISCPSTDILLPILEKNYEFRLPKNSNLHLFATDPFLYKLVCQNPPCPDNLIFCGKQPLLIDFWEDQEIKVKDFHRYVVIKNFGLILPKKTSKTTEEMLEALLQIYLRLEDFNIKLLNDKDCHELLNWSQEKYRMESNKIKLK